MIESLSAGVYYRRKEVAVVKGQTYIILAIIFALLVAIFAVINVDPVQVDYLFGSGEAPLILVILISVLMGGIITASVGSLRYFRLKQNYRSLEKKMQNGTENTPEEPTVSEKDEEKGSNDEPDKHKDR
nr:lipopolysaccharide assembly protein LapA domain-containing protein [Salimicrobium jeotgali]